MSTSTKKPAAKKSGTKGTKSTGRKSAAKTSSAKSAAKKTSAAPKTPTAAPKTSAGPIGRAAVAADKPLADRATAIMRKHQKTGSKRSPVSTVQIGLVRDRLAKPTPELREALAVKSGAVKPLDVLGASTAAAKKLASGTTALDSDKLADTRSRLRALANTFGTASTKNKLRGAKLLGVVIALSETDK